MKMMILLMDRFYRDIAKVARFKHNYSASFGRYTCLYFQLDMSHTIIGLVPSYGKIINKNTIRDGGSTALNTVDTVFIAYTNQTALHCLNLYTVREGHSSF